MSANGQIVDPVKGASKLVRAKFSPGMLLRDDDLEQLNLYTQELNRLMFSSLFGCGVICGLVVTIEVNCEKVIINVGAGLALDGCGNPVHVPKQQRIVFDEGCGSDIPSSLWVVLCRIEQCCAPRSAACTSDYDDGTTSVCTRERDGFEIRIVRDRPKGLCGCKPVEKTVGKETRDVNREKLDNPEDERQSDDECWCANPKDPCYADHYSGKCGCDCSGSCSCDCILLASVTRSEVDGKTKWTADHSQRHFIRPVLMRDPQVEIENEARRKTKNQTKEQESAPTKV
ncbi:hypothetical protein Q8F57_000565 [Paraburkholderia terrae]|uniref:hypothetical protein n=1 Tax=Paraburkholderia terrae TaxID=311230 RepID=UPI00296ACBAB|nr:hypothetical protein [Paraburkholderia terrae]MDW3660610.1 hypothetical protein [Paraburkholderia terrae]